MARVHNQISRGSFNDALKRILGVEKPQDGLERFGETLQPILDLWSRPEWNTLRGDLLWATFGTVAASALNFSRIQIENPDGSDKIVVIEGILWSALGGASTAYSITTMGALASTPAASPARDLRDGTGLVTVSVSRIGNDLPAISGTEVERQRNEVINELMWSRAAPFVLAPGHRIEVTQRVINTAFEASFWGRERTALSGELR